MITLSSMNPKDENILHTFDFSNLIAVGDSIAAVVGVTADPEGLTIGTPTVVDGARGACAVQCALGGGTVRTNYIVTTEVTTANGRNLARSVTVPVQLV